MPNTERLLASLRSISEAGGPAFIDVGDAEQLAELGLIERYGFYRYLITPRGEDVLLGRSTSHH